MTLSMRLTGTKVGIEYTLVALKTQGYEWKGDNKYYPQRGSTSQFSCYLNDVTVPPIMPAASAVATQSDNESQPRPWDAVLGGKGQI